MDALDEHHNSSNKWLYIEAHGPDTPQLPTEVKRGTGTGCIPVRVYSDTCIGRRNTFRNACSEYDRLRISIGKAENKFTSVDNDSRSHDA